MFICFSTCTGDRSYVISDVFVPSLAFPKPRAAVDQLKSRDEPPSKGRDSAPQVLDHSWSYWIGHLHAGFPRSFENLEIID